MKFAIATHNLHKLEELKRILQPLGVDVVPAEYNDVEETGTTFAENALLKAEAACKAMGIPAVADDSGLSVDALNGEPGVYSARWAGENATDKERYEKLLDKMKDVPKGKRSAKFVSAVCCAFPDGRKVEALGECPGEIAFAPAGEDGFGYDPVFLVGDKTYAQMTPEEKDAVSHRGKALRMFVEYLKNGDYLN